MLCCLGFWGVFLVPSYVCVIAFCLFEYVKSLLLPELLRVWEAFCSLLNLVLVCLMRFGLLFIED